MLLNMKALILAILLTLTVAVPSLAEAATTASFTWDTPTDITWGTKVYIGTEPGIYTNSEDAGIGTSEYTLDNALEYDTTYYFTATHYDPAEGLESEYATEISWTSPGPDSILFNPMARKKEHPIKSYIMRFIFK